MHPLLGNCLLGTLVGQWGRQQERWHLEIGLTDPHSLRLRHQQGPGSNNVTISHADYSLVTHLRSLEPTVGRINKNLNSSKGDMIAVHAKGRQDGTKHSEILHTSA
jgi:hypothetical protein